MTLHAFVLLASIQISIRRLSRARLYFFHSCDDEKRSHDQHGLAVLKLVFYSIRKCLLSKGPKSVAELWWACKSPDRMSARAINAVQMREVASARPGKNPLPVPCMILHKAPLKTTMVS